MKIVVLTVYADDPSVINAQCAGGRGYLTKDAGSEQIRRALRQAAGNGAVIGPAAQRYLFDVLGAAATRPRCPTVRGERRQASRQAHAT